MFCVFVKYQHKCGKKKYRNCVYVYEILQKKLSRHLFLFFYTELYENEGVQILSIFDYFNIALFQCDRVVNVSIG